MYMFVARREPMLVAGGASVDSLGSPWPLHKHNHHLNIRPLVCQKLHHHLFVRLLALCMPVALRETTLMGGRDVWVRSGYWRKV
jgi:hypothetical protein